MTIVDVKETGNNIRNIMEKNAMTPKDVQQAIGCGTVNTIYTWMNGQKMPSIDNIAQMTGIFGVSMNDIIATKTI